MAGPVSKMWDAQTGRQHTASTGDSTHVTAGPDAAQGPDEAAQANIVVGATASQDADAEAQEDATAQEEAGPLAHTLVVDLSRALAGPHAAMMLADLGARVIKVEAPGGDEARGWGPPFAGEDSTYFFSCNRNKESIRIDLKSEEGLSTLRSLLERADVVIENFRPGVLERLGLSVSQMHQLNPRLVILSITGFGHDGPEGGRPGYDQIAQGEAGLMSLTGQRADEPTKVGVPIGDLLAGIYGAYGVSSALAARARTGKGCVVRTSLLAALVGVHAFQGTRYTVAGEVPQAVGNHHPTIAPYGAFACSDGLIQIACGNEDHWRRLAQLLGIDAEDPRFANNLDRVGHHSELVEEMEAVLSQQPREHWLGKLSAAGVAAGAIRTIDEVYTWEQAHSQGLLISVEHPEAGTVRLPGPPLRLEDNRGRTIGARDHLAPPTLGQHDQAIRSWLNAEHLEQE